VVGDGDRGVFLNSVSPPGLSTRGLDATFSKNTLTLQRYSAIMTQKNGGYVMATTAKRATIYLDPIIHKALKIKSIETSRSVSDLVNQAIREALAEDAEDLAAFEERANESLLSYDQMVKRLKKDGRI